MQVETTRMMVAKFVLHRKKHVRDIGSDSVAFSRREESDLMSYSVRERLCIYTSRILKRTPHIELCFCWLAGITHTQGFFFTQKAPLGESF